MNNQNLIIYDFNSLYNILEELNLNINFNVLEASNEKLLNDYVNKLNNYLILTNKKHLKYDHQILIENLPLSIFKLVEKINIEFLKLQLQAADEVIKKEKEKIINNQKLVQEEKGNTKARREAIVTSQEKIIKTEEKREKLLKTDRKSTRLNSSHRT